MIWPKLFRRIVRYLAAGFGDFDGFHAWLRADPRNRDDELFLLDRLERANLHDVVEAAGRQVRLTAWPERFVISPDPATPGSPTEPAPVSAGDVLVVAALPDPAPNGIDHGHERITLLNTTASPIDLTGWLLVDAAGDRERLGGFVAAGGVTQIVLDGGARLGNRGDAIVLVNPAGRTVDHVAYRADQVRRGRTICFGR